MFVLRVMCQLLNYGNIVDVFFVSINVWAQVAIFTRMWTRCGHCAILRQVVYLVELPVQRRLYQIFVKS